MSNLILLTGAGFTKNFGGFLDNAVKGTIGDCLQNEKLKKRIQNDPYEQIYQELNSEHSRYSEYDREQFNEAISQSYADMDNAITKKLEELNDRKRNILQLFFQKFHYTFTLNQDLFLERAFGYHSLLTNQFSDDYKPINPFDDWANGKHGFPELVTSEFEELLQKQPYKDDFKYIKIHGSYKWQDFDTSNVHIMGVGISKQSKVWDYPLLRIYLAFFGNRLIDGNGVLVVFGYGFGDMHINDYICWGINKGLKLIIVGWNDFDCFKKKLEESIKKTYLYDIFKLPSPENLEVEISEKTSKIIDAIDEYHSLKDQDIFKFLESFT